MNKNKLKYCAYAAFIAAEVGIYVAFNILAAVAPSDPIALKYSGVLLCLVFCAVMTVFYKKDAAVLAVALAFTALSDLFIFVLDDYYEVGVSIFVLEQSVYLYRLYSGRYKRIYITLAVRAVLAAIAMIVLAVCAELDYLLAVVCVYFVMLCANCVEAFMKIKGGFKDALFAVGLLLFIGCDVCVGLHNFGSALGVDLPRGVQAFAQYAMWAFYLPSQVCIVCSVKNKGVNDEAVQTI